MKPGENEDGCNPILEPDLRGDPFPFPAPASCRAAWAPWPSPSCTGPRSPGPVVGLVPAGLHERAPHRRRPGDRPPGLHGRGPLRLGRSRLERSGVGHLRPRHLAGPGAAGGDAPRRHVLLPAALRLAGLGPRPPGHEPRVRRPRPALPGRHRELVGGQGAQVPGRPRRLGHRGRAAERAAGRWCGPRPTPAASPPTRRCGSPARRRATRRCARRPIPRARRSSARSTTARTATRPGGRT